MSKKPDMRGRPKKAPLDRKNIPKYIELLKAGPSDDYCKHLFCLFEFSPPPCQICRYHELIFEAQRCIKLVHENNLKVFSRWKGGGKRALLAGLLAPWLDSSLLYPFNLNLDDSRRSLGYIPPGYRRIDDHEIVVDQEMAGLNPDEVDFDLVEYPENGRYAIEFDQDQWDNRLIAVDTTIHLRRKPMSPEAWVAYEVQLDEIEKRGWGTVSAGFRERKKSGWKKIKFGEYLKDRLAKRDLEISWAKSGSKEGKDFDYTIFPGFKYAYRSDGQWVLKKVTIFWITMMRKKSCCQVLIQLL